MVSKILTTSTKLSSVSASVLLKSNSIKVGKSSICVLLKKMPPIVDKSSVKQVCVDDFVFRKRYTYGTIMVDLESHRIIDIIDTRETTEVAEWLKAYPNIEVISRDGAQVYASASSYHPMVIQISDRFHLLKNLSEAVEKYMRHLFPSRLEIPATAATQSQQMQALYDSRNRYERTRFIQAKRDEGYTINDIALLLHSSVTTISKYLALPEDKIPKEYVIAREGSAFGLFIWNESKRQLKSQKIIF